MVGEVNGLQEKEELTAEACEEQPVEDVSDAEETGAQTVEDLSLIHI